jgi:hypothetical protein
MEQTPVRCQGCGRVLTGLGPDDPEHSHGSSPPPESSPQEQNQTPLPRYKYDPLPDDRRFMRLLVLFPERPDNPQVQCKLIPVNVNFELEQKTNGSSKLDYEALSWCWGTAEPTSFIEIQKNNLIYSKYLKPDLVAALTALRHPKESRYLWIDAIFIDQDDIPEKNHQVEMMSTIYGQASGVCIWLGEGNTSSTRAIRFISDEVLQLRNFDKILDTAGLDRKDAIAKWDSLLELIQRPWFSRRWVIQEIALARDAMIYCGGDNITWKDFAAAIELLVEAETTAHRLSETMKKSPLSRPLAKWFEFISALRASLLVAATGKMSRNAKFTGLSETGEERYSHKPLLSLEYLVSSLSMFDVTVEHDTIYALLAIANDTVPPVSLEDKLADRRIKQALGAFQHRESYTVAYESLMLMYARHLLSFAFDNRNRHVL